MALRLAHIYLPRKTPGLLEELTEKFSIIEHFEAGDENRQEIKLLLDAEETEPVLDYIENRYGRREGFRVITLPVEAVIPRLEPTEEPSPDDGNQPQTKDAKRIYREELYEDINAVSSIDRALFYWWCYPLLLPPLAYCAPMWPLSSVPWSLRRCWAPIWEWRSQQPWAILQWAEEPSKPAFWDIASPLPSQ